MYTHWCYYLHCYTTLFPITLRPRHSDSHKTLGIPHGLDRHGWSIGNPYLMFLYSFCNFHELRNVTSHLNCSSSILFWDFSLECSITVCKNFTILIITTPHFLPRTYRTFLSLCVSINFIISNLIIYSIWSSCFSSTSHSWSLHVRHSFHRYACYLPYCMGVLSFVFLSMLRFISTSLCKRAFN